VTLDALFDALADTPRTLLFHDPPSGLRAVLCVDDLRLGPAAGGIRTRRYPSVAEALADARRLSRAMSHKCALAGLRAGGAKTVVLDHDALDRPRAFAALGARIEELAGLYHCAGDLGTTDADLDAVASRTRFVHRGDGLADAVARGMVACVRACAERRSRPLGSLRIAVQGCGAIGSAVARRFRELGAEVVVADLDAGRAERLVVTTGASIVAPADILSAEVDVLAPCATGGVVDAKVAEGMSAWVLAPGANNALADPEVAGILHERGVLHVPDVVASAGAVIAGLALMLMNTDPDRLIAALATTTADLLERSMREDVPTETLARVVAEERLAAAEPVN